MTFGMDESTGRCQLCGAEVEPGSMRKHLTGCIEEYRYEVIGRDDDSDPIAGYHLAFQAKRAPVYWLHVLARADATLAQLDSLLRDAWMEDRSKHSRFVIGNSVYSSEPPTSVTPTNRQGDMSVELQEVVENDQFEYAYDLELTTKLEGRTIDQRNILPDRRETPVRLIARNDPPDIPCQCGSVAQILCPRCSEGAAGWICEACAGDHDCFDDGATPSRIENTPRAIVHI
jgi:hypothetical protein